MTLIKMKVNWCRWIVKVCFTIVLTIGKTSDSLRFTWDKFFRWKIIIMNIGARSQFILEIIDAYFFNHEKHCSAACVLTPSNTNKKREYYHSTTWKWEITVHLFVSGFICKRQKRPTWFLKCILSTLMGVDASSSDAAVRFKSRPIWLRTYSTKWQPSSYTKVGDSRPDTKRNKQKDSLTFNWRLRHTSDACTK